MIYVLFYISEFPDNIYVFITHGLARASNIPTPSLHKVSPSRFYFFNLVPILCTSIIPIHNPIFPIYGIEY